MAKKKTVTNDPSVLPSISTMLGKELAIGEPLFIMGRIHTLREVDGKFGDQVQFKGEFGAKVGEAKFTSTKAYLPYQVSDILESALQTRKDKTPIEFAVQFTKVLSNKSKKGFVWEHEVIKMPEIVVTNVFNLID